MKQITIAANAGNNLKGKLLKSIAPMLDRLLGIDKMEQLYQQGNFAHLPKEQFCLRLIEKLEITIEGQNDIINKVPNKGPCIVVCNHPYGMIEGVIVSQMLHSYRADTKVMANIGLKIFQEIQDYFIFANPLKPKSPINTKAIKQCFKHVRSGGLLVIFPAGRVSFYQKQRHGVSDGDWDRLAVQIAQKYQAPLLPVFISGQNSRLFYRLGRVYYRFRLLMLAREMFKLNQRTISMHCTNPMIITKDIPMNSANDLARIQCYLNHPDYYTPWPPAPIESNQLQPLQAPQDGNAMAKELDALPAKQCLVQYKQFKVYFGYQQQIPLIVSEISRLRELVFRQLDEGSGAPCDTDKYDALYTHLFIFDHEHHQIIGAYRMGQTDRLRAANTPVYLSQMFNFSADFINQRQDCLEMGRSFIVPEHQGSYHGLLLLFKGIGAFVRQHPQYQTLYGTVSLTTQYDPRSVALMERFMVSTTDAVSAKIPLNQTLQPEVADYCQLNHRNIEHLSHLVATIEDDNKDIPILMKQYYNLGAQFHCVAIDGNFANTPGMLLSVHIPSLTPKQLKVYLGKDYQTYLDAVNND